MRGEDMRGAYSESNSDTESIVSDRAALSGSLVKRSTKKSARFNIPGETQINNGDNDHVEITLDIRNDSVVLHSVQAISGAENEDPENALLGKTSLEKKTSFGAYLYRNTSSHIRQMSQELKRFASLTRRRYDRTKPAATHALKGLKFIATNTGSASWSGVEKKFDKLTANTNGLLHCNDFGKCIGMIKVQDEEFAGELFRALARIHNISKDSINKAELKDFWHRISEESFHSRLQTFFDMLDKDADGRITKEEVAEIIRLSASANKLGNIKTKVKEYARLIMEELDPEDMGYIMVEDLEMMLVQAPNQSVRVTDSTILSQMLSQRLKPTQVNNPTIRCYEKAKHFFLDNWKRVWIMILWLSIVAGLFVYKFIQYKNKAAYEVMGYCVCTAKGAGETLKFNMALILLPVCKNTITWLRNKTKLGVAVPFGDNLNFHKVIAIGIAVGVALHAVAHLACDFPRILDASEEKYELMKPFFGEDQPESYWWFVKGFEGVCHTPPEGKSGLLRADYDQGNNPIFPKMLIDGPYGAPAQEYKQYEVVLLLGLGIGATPMVSIVKDIVNNIIKRDDGPYNTMENGRATATLQTPGSSNSKSQNSRGGGGGGGLINTRKAYFYWVTREQGSYSWFKSMMNEVAEMDMNEVIEMHSHCTSVYEEGDARSALIEMLQSLHHAKNGVDVVSDTKVKSHFAKPNWYKVYKKVAVHHPHSRVGVFYCGPPGPTNELRDLALDFSHKTSTKFEFHKENF